MESLTYTIAILFTFGYSGTLPLHKVDWRVTITKKHPNFDPGLKAEETPMLLFHFFPVSFGIFYLYLYAWEKTDEVKSIILLCHPWNVHFFISKNGNFGGNGNYSRLDTQHLVWKRMHSKI